MKITLTAFSLLAAISIHAQDSTLLLDPVSITASIRPTETSATGRNILSINGSGFAGLPIHSIDELLRYLPGVEAQMRGPLGAQSDIVIRGSTFQQVLVLLDGMRINDPNTGHFNSYIPISPAEIERVEILKGASSALYGSDAVGGVIQVITKTFAARKGQHKLRLNAEAAAGEYGLLHANAGGFYQQGNTAISGGWLTNQTDGQLQRGTRGYVHANTASVSGTQFIGSHWQVALRAAYDHRSFSAQNFYTSFASDTASEEITSWWTQARITYAGFAAHRISMDVSYKNLKDEYAFAKSSIPNQSTSEMLQAVIRDEWTLSNNSSIVSGIQSINKSIRSNDRGHHTLDQLGAFVLLSHSFNRHFVVNPALRLDYNKLSGAELVPQLSLSYKEGRWLFRGSAGKTIRDPDFTERFNNYNKAVVTSGRIGNPFLAAERSFSYEAGADWFAGSQLKGLKISATFFQRLHRRLIDYVNTIYADMPRKDNLTPGSTYALAQNITRVNTTGVEIDLQYQRNFSAASALLAGAGFTWADDKSGQGEPSFYISSHANVLVNGFLEYRYKGFIIALNGVYKERGSQAAQAINATITRQYFIANGKLAYSLLPKRLSIFTEVNNIMDKDYSDLLGAVMPGRWFSAGLSIQFER